MSLLSQLIVSALFTFPAIGAVAMAFQQSWPKDLAMSIVLPLFVAMFIMNWYDNKYRNA